MAATGANRAGGTIAIPGMSAAGGVMKSGGVIRSGNVNAAGTSVIGIAAGNISIVATIMTVTITMAATIMDTITINAKRPAKPGVSRCLPPL
jgi:hypothetical protein